MPRPIHKLSARKVKTVTKKGRYGDGGGLSLVVTGSGSKHWIFRYMRNRKAHEIGLGSIALSLSGARAKAAECREALANGQDPRGVRRRGDIPTFRTLAEELLAGKKSGWAESYAKKWRRQLDYIYGVSV
jgi:Arm domain-containing DNA-binding protein